MDVSAPASSANDIGFITPRRPRRPVPRRGRGLSSKAQSQVKRIIAVRQELKYAGNVSAYATYPAAPTLSKLLIIAQGDGDQQRDGDRIMWCGTFELKLAFINSNADLFNSHRVIVFQWHPNDATAPISTSVLLSGVSGAPDYTSHYSHDQRQLYTILFDKTFVTVGPIPGSAAITPTTSESVTGLHFYKLSTRNLQKQVQYAGGSTNGTNQIYIITMNDTVSAAGARPQVLFTFKGFYRDS